MAIPFRDDAPTRRTPWVTWALILANIVVFLFLQPAFFQSGRAESDRVSFEDIEEAQKARAFLYKWGAIPCEAEQGEPLSRLSETSKCEVRFNPSGSVLPEDKHVWLALLTSIFLHGGIAHLASNMLFLWVFGNNVEDRLGHVTYLIFYLVGGVLATAGHVVFNRGSIQPVVGASGAIAAVMGAYFVFKPRGRILTVVVSAAFQIVYIPAFVVLGLFFVTQFFTPTSSNVAWEAHAVGMGVGVLAAFVLARVFPDPDRTPHAAIATASVGPPPER